MSKRLLLFLAGLLVGALLSQTRAVEAASQLMFGSYNGATKAVVVDTNGAVIVQFN